MSNKRKVVVSEYVYSGGPQMSTQDKGIATFEAYGIGGITTSDAGLKIYSTAIVEWPDGTVQSVVLDLIRFIE